MSAQDSMPSPELFQPAEEYDGYLACISNGHKQIHIVDATTFAQWSAPDSYDKYAANLGKADSLCGGKRRLGRLIPLPEDRKMLKSSVCGHCLKALSKLEVTDDE